MVPRPPGAVTGRGSGCTVLVEPAGPVPDVLDRRACDDGADADGSLPFGGALTEEEVAELGLADFEPTGSHSVTDEVAGNAPADADLHGHDHESDLPLEEQGSRSARTGYGLRPSTALRRPNRLVFLVRHVLALMNELLGIYPGSVPTRSPTIGRRAP
jgi:hypothetical protein